MIKIWECFEQVVTSCFEQLWSHVEMSGFYASDVATCSKHSQFFTTAYTCDNMTPRQVSWFSDFVWTLYNFKTLFRQVARHVTWRRCAKFDASSWIETQHTPNTMNNIFRSTRLQYSMHLQFKFELYIKIQHNQINQPNITKKTRKSTKFEHEVVNNVGGPNKKIGVKKTENLPSGGPGALNK